MEEFLNDIDDDDARSPKEFADCTAMWKNDINAWLLGKLTEYEVQMLERRLEFESQMLERHLMEQNDANMATLSKKEVLALSVAKQKSANFLQVLVFMVKAGFGSETSRACGVSRKTWTNGAILTSIAHLRYGPNEQPRCTLAVLAARSDWAACLRMGHLLASGAGALLLDAQDSQLRCAFSHACARGFVLTAHLLAIYPRVRWVRKAARVKVEKGSEVISDSITFDSITGSEIIPDSITEHGKIMRSGSLLEGEEEEEEEEEERGDGESWRRKNGTENKGSGKDASKVEEQEITEALPDVFRAPIHFAYGPTPTSGAGLFSRTLLCEMVLQDKREVVDLLLRIETIDREKGHCDGDSPLICACEKGLVDMIRTLCDGGLDVMRRGARGRTPLLAACEANEVGAVSVLLSRADCTTRAINATDDAGWWALLWMAFHGNTEGSAVLLAHGARINQVGKDGMSALGVAMRKGFIEHFRALLRYDDIDINAGDSRNADLLLMWACQNGDAKIAEIVMQKVPELNVSAKGFGGDSPLHHAIAQARLDMCQMLLDRHADVNLVNDHGDTPLIVAAVRNLVDIVELLIAQPGLKINAFSNEGSTALFYAAARGHTATVLALLGHPRAGINKLDKLGWSPLMVACSNGYTEIVAALVQHPCIEVNVGDKFKGYTALHRACENGHLEVIRILVAHPQILLNKGGVYNGFTPVVFATQRGHKKVVEFLLSLPDIDVSHGDFHGNGAIRYAGPRKKDINNIISKGGKDAFL